MLCLWKFRDIDMWSHDYKVKTYIPLEVMPTYMKKKGIYYKAANMIY